MVPSCWPATSRDVLYQCYVKVHMTRVPRKGQEGETTPEGDRNASAWRESFSNFASPWPSTACTDSGNRPMPTMRGSSPAAFSRSKNATGTWAVQCAHMVGWQSQDVSVGNAVKLTCRCHPVCDKLVTRWIVACFVWCWEGRNGHQ